MSRKNFEWKICDKVLQLGDRTLLLGVLNLTPDSFSDGGKFLDPDRAFAHAIELEEQGADIIDIGAESTRPGAVRISEAEELRRLVPVLKRLKNKLSIPISVDTYKAGVALKALELGADIINDPSGLTFDPELADAVKQADAGLIINHMRGTPETWAKLPPMKSPMTTIATELDASVHRAIRGGVERRRIVIDPGLGFGKRKEQNAEILAHLEELARLEYPIMVGPSRKHFLAKQSDAETEFASAAAVTAAILYGAHMVRVHDVKAMKAVAEVADEILRARDHSRENAEPAGVYKPEYQKPEGGRPPANLRESARVFNARSAARPIDPRPLQVKPVVVQPAVVGPNVVEPIVVESIVVQPALTEPTVAAPTVVAPTIAAPTVAELTARQPAAIAAAVKKPVDTRPAITRPDYRRPDNTRSANARPENTRPPNRRPDNGRPGNGRPDNARPASSRASTSRPPGSRPPSRPFNARSSDTRFSNSRPAGKNPMRRGPKGPQTGRSSDSQRGRSSAPPSGARTGPPSRTNRPPNRAPRDRPSGPPRTK